VWFELEQFTGEELLTNLGIFKPYSSWDVCLLVSDIKQQIIASEKLKIDHSRHHVDRHGKEVSLSLRLWHTLIVTPCLQQ